MKLLIKAVTTFLILLLVLAVKTYYDAGEFSYNGREKNLRV